MYGSRQRRAIGLSGFCLPCRRIPSHCLMTAVTVTVKTRLKPFVPAAASSPEAPPLLLMSFLFRNLDPHLTCHGRSLDMNLVTLSLASPMKCGACVCVRASGWETLQTKSPGLTEIIPSELFHYVPGETERLNLLLTRGFIGSHIALGEASRRST